MASERREVIARRKRSSGRVREKEMVGKKRNVWYLEIIIKDPPEDRGGGVTVIGAIRRYSLTFSCGVLRLLVPHILRAPNNSRGQVQLAGFSRCCRLMLGWMRKVV